MINWMKRMMEALTRISQGKFYIVFFLNRIPDLLYMNIFLHLFRRRNLLIQRIIEEADTVNMLLHRN